MEAVPKPKEAWELLWVPITPLEGTQDCSSEEIQILDKYWVPRTKKVLPFIFMDKGGV